MASPIFGNTTIGSAVFTYNIVPGNNNAYDTQAVVVIQVGAVKSQAHLFTPTNPNWEQNGILVGNATLDVNITYTPPVPGGQLGNVTLNSGTIKVGTQAPQSLTNATLVNWDNAGNVY
jgi:hypothetical protein